MNQILLDKFGAYLIDKDYKKAVCRHTCMMQNISLFFYKHKQLNPLKFDTCVI